MPASFSPSRPRHYLALATAGATFLLVIAGGLVWATESALACPDWPLCHGEAFPQLTGRVLFEVGHRYLAGTVSVLTLALAAWLWRLGGWRRGAGVAAVGLVVFQALLGALTVWLKLPLVVRVAHLAVSQAFFASVAWMVFATRKPQSKPNAISPGTACVASWAVLAAYVQLLLGAFVRHTGAGLVCNANVFYCNGSSLWPPAQDGFGAFGPAQVVTLHKAFALAVAALVAWTAWRVLREAQGLPKRLALIACALVLLQIGLGVVSVLTYLGIAVVTAHLATGSALFVSLVALRLALNELGTSARSERSRGPNHAEVRPSTSLGTSGVSAASVGAR
jgi:heme A synthase